MPWKEDLSSLIGDGQHLQAIDLLKKVMAYTKDTYAANTLIMMSASYNGLERKKAQGTMRRTTLPGKRLRLIIEFWNFPIGSMILSSTTVSRYRAATRVGEEELPHPQKTETQQSRTSRFSSSPLTLRKRPVWT